jgi:hypothetical protein
MRELSCVVIPGDKVLLTHQKHDIWVKRTPEEVQALRDRDRAAGRWHDDGGEPILYGPYSGWPQDVTMLTLVVTSRRPKWMHYHKRPVGLRAGWSTKLGREVLFRSV